MQQKSKLLDFGDRVAGQVCDEDAWFREGRVRAAIPARHVVGEVAAIYPHAPELVEVRLGSGPRVLVAVGGVRCEDCPHSPHPTGDCLVAILTADGDDGYCLCGAE